MATASSARDTPTHYVMRGPVTILRLRRSPVYWPPYMNSDGTNEKDYVARKKAVNAP